MKIKTIKNEGWKKDFDSLFEDMDVWIYANPITDPKGIRFKSMDGKKEIKYFISQELEIRDNELIEKIKKMKKNIDYSDDWMNESYEKALDDVISLINSQK